MENAIFSLAATLLLAGQLAGYVMHHSTETELPPQVVESTLGAPTNITIGGAAVGQQIQSCALEKTYENMEARRPLVFNFTSENAKTGGAPVLGYSYVGKGLDKGDCGVTIANTTLEDFGEWKYTFLMVMSKLWSIPFKGTIIVRMIVTFQEGEFKCDSRKCLPQTLKCNEKGNEANTPQTQKAKNDWLMPVVTATLVVTALLIFAFLLMERRNRKSFVSRHELNNFLNGNSVASENAHKVPYDKNLYEIKKECFSIENNGMLGAGEYGWACRGKIMVDSQEITVAVKMVTPQKIHKTSINGFLSEIKVLAYLGKHQHITELLGANTSELKLGKIYIYLELCPLGSLEKYLRGMRPLPKSTASQSNDALMAVTDASELRPLSVNSLNPSYSANLYRWSMEICEGMVFQATKHVVHADLATRNVLLGANKEATICDFGLSRRMYNYASYVKEQQEPLPWKWMAPESLRLNEFNEKTDVWAYGVTLWEIYSLGDSPYPGMSWDVNFPQMLQRGLTLGEAQCTNNNIYSVMKTCWDLNPLCRPSFLELKSKYLVQRKTL